MSLDTTGLYDRIREALGASNPSEIARMVKLTPQSVYLWQKGNLPSIETLDVISSVSNTSIHWLLTGQGSQSSVASAALEPGEVPVYFGPWLQAKLRDLAKDAHRTFGEEVRDIVIRDFERRGIVNQPEESNIVFFGEPVRSVNLPLMGWIAAGEPIHAVVEKQEVSVPDFFMKRGKQYFVLHVRGDSMIEDEIADNSLIICEARESAENGEKIVALIDGDKATVKRIYHEGDRIRLQPANPLHKPIYIEPNQTLDIQGVVVGIFHKPA